VSGIAWTSIRNAIQSWVVQSSGLTGDRVIWTGQGGPRPVGSYAELKLKVEHRGRGIDEQKFILANNVLTEKLRGMRRAILTITVWQGAPPSAAGLAIPGDAWTYDPLSFGPAFGVSSGLSAPPVIMDDILTAARLTAIHEALTAAGVGFGHVDMIDLTGDVIDDVEFEARSIATVTLHVASEVSYTYPTGTGWISTVNASGLPGDLQPINFSTTG
jgi:hypothetical protein